MTDPARNKWVATASLVSLDCIDPSIKESLYPYYLSTLIRPWHVQKCLGWSGPNSEPRENKYDTKIINRKPTR